MIVDDEPSIQELMAIILEDMGHSVVAQSLNGEEALKDYEKLKKKPDLIIIDHRMPIMSGAELAEVLIRTHPDQRILFLSADNSARELVSKMGISNFLEKPVDIETIRSAVSAALDQS